MKNEEYKYDYDIDFNNMNPPSIILKKIRRNSKVLEIGPSVGYMTKYMTNTLNCAVTCIEIDEESASSAKNFCQKMIVGDIDIIDLNKELDEEYDFIIIADVLEHLYRPDKVLNKLKEFLKDDGEIWISTPNISHFSVIDELIKNRFKYNGYGILDNTHIRFFTMESLLEMVHKCGYLEKDIFKIEKKPEETEFNTNMSMIPQYISDYVKEKNEDYMTYQFVISILKSDEKSIEIKKLKQKIEKYELLFKNMDEEYSRLYMDFGNGFSEENSCSSRIETYGRTFRVIFDDFNKFKCLYAKSIRFDPIENRSSCFKINNIKYLDDKNIERTISINDTTSNAEFIKKDGEMCFLNIDPQIYFNKENIILKKIYIDGTFKLSDDNELEKYYVNEIYSLKKELESKNSEIESKNLEIENISNELEVSNKKINDYCKITEEKNITILGLQEENKINNDVISKFKKSKIYRLLNKFI